MNLPMLILWVIATIGAIYAAHFIYCITQAVVGRAFGIEVEVVAVGYKPFGAGITWRGSHWEWQIGLVPLGGFTRFADADNVAPIENGFDQENHLIDGKDAPEGSKPPKGTVQAASSLAIIVVLAVGPLSQFVFGAALLLAPVFLGSDQIVRSEGETTLQPTSVGQLAIVSRPATLESQIELCRSLSVSAFNRFLFIKPLKPWGGLIGAVVTCGAAGTTSVYAWMTLAGCLLTFMAVANLLPIPCLNGFRLLAELVNAIRRDTIADRTLLNLTFAGLIFLIGLMIRVFVADAFWLFGWYS